MDRVNGADWVDIGSGRRGFRGRDALAGVRGTEVTANWLNTVQEELLALVELSGGAASSADSQQVSRASMSQRLNWVAGVGGTANALTIALTPAPAALADLIGVPLRLKIATANTLGATLSVNGLTAMPITRPSGVALQAGDLAVGSIVTVVYDGTVYRALTLPNFGVTGAPSVPWTRWPNGLIIQFGSLGTSSSGAVFIAYPISFTTVTVAVVVTDESSPVTASQMSVFGTGGYTLSGFQVIATRDFSTNLSDSANYIAVGY